MFKRKERKKENKKLSPAKTTGFLIRLRNNPKKPVNKKAEKGDDGVFSFKRNREQTSSLNPKGKTERRRRRRLR